MGEDGRVRKVWLGVSVGIGVSFSFVALLVVGTYMVAADLIGGAGGKAVGLAKGSVPSSYEPLIQQYGNSCPAINPALLAAQLYQESGWNAKAQSPANAKGIAQFIPATWASHGVDGNKDGVRDIWDPQDAIPSAATPMTARSPSTSRTCRAIRRTTCWPRTTRAPMP